MKRYFFIMLVCIFLAAAASLTVVQFIQTKRAVAVSDNLFNISVNNAMEGMIEQLNRLKVEDYIDQHDRYRLLKYKRVSELNDRMQDVIKEHYTLFYDTTLVSVGASMIDSVFLLKGVTVSSEDSAAIRSYNTLLASRDRLVGGTDFYDRFVDDISEYVVDNLITASSFNYELLDSLIVEKLRLNGVDIRPSIGLYDHSSDEFLYCNASGKEQLLRESPFKYRFHPNGLMSPDEYFIVLQFPPTAMLLHDSARRYLMVSISLVMVILLLFFQSMRTIAKQRKLDEMKTNFISNMTHEINTPISTIGLACEMLQEGNGGDAKTYIGIIDEENRRMRRMVDKILQSTRMANGRSQMQMQEVDLHELATASADRLRLRIEHLGGTIDLDLQAGQHTIVGDPLHLSNVIDNLVDNAIKYSPDHLEIRIATHNVGKQVALSVSDKGLGIAKADQAHIFERFYRVSTGDRHDVKGFGIGLNYVAGVAKQHGGRVTLDSEIGKGSTFTLLLPIMF